MKTTTARFTTRGRITIPAALRKKYKLHQGTKVKFIDEDDGTCLAGRQVKIIPLVTEEEIKANIGFLGMKGKMLKSLMEEKKKEREL